MRYHIYTVLIVIKNNRLIIDIKYFVKNLKYLELEVSSLSFLASFILHCVIFSTYINLAEFALEQSLYKSTRNIGTPKGLHDFPQFRIHFILEDIIDFLNRCVTAAVKERIVSVENLEGGEE